LNSLRINYQRSAKDNPVIIVLTKHAHSLEGAARVSLASREVTKGAAPLPRDTLPQTNEDQSAQARRWALGLV
jgi:hypothetical protein